MEEISGAVEKSAGTLASDYAALAFFIFVLLAIIAILWRALEKERVRNDALQLQTNAEIKSGIAMANEFRKTFEVATTSLSDKIESYEKLLVESMDHKRRSG